MKSADNSFDKHRDWFVQNSRSGEVPEESTIRKRLAALWRKLRGEEPV
jgi:hypothetical protein